jgi:hypothetical protein
MGRGSDENRGDDELNLRPRADSSDDERVGLSERQERLLDKLDSLPPVQTRDLAQGLGLAMQRMAEDREVWEELERAGAAPSDLGPARYLALVDWETLLSEWDLPEVETTALEMIDSVDRGATGQPEWGNVRDLIGQLGTEIAGDAAETPVNSGRWTRLKERVAVAGSVMKRLQKLRLVVNAAAGAIGQVAPGLIAAAFGVAPPAVAAVVSLGVVGAMTGIGGQVRAALHQLPEEDQPLLNDLFNSPELGLGKVGGAQADLGLIEAMLSDSGGVVCEEAIAGPLGNLRLWAARVGARLLSSWWVVQTRIGDAAVRNIERILEGTVRLGQTLREVAKLCDATVERKSQGMLAGMALISEIGNGLTDLDRMLAACGFGGHRT